MRGSYNHPQVLRHDSKTIRSSWRSNLGTRSRSFQIGQHLKTLPFALTPHPITDFWTDAPLGTHTGTCESNNPARQATYYFVLMCAPWCNRASEHSSNSLGRDCIPSHRSRESLSRSSGLHPTSRTYSSTRSPQASLLRVGIGRDVLVGSAETSARACACTGMRRGSRAVIAGVGSRTAASPSRGPSC